MVDNLQTDKMVSCLKEGCSDYFYQMANYDNCPRHRI
tara:strand:- start:4150 stop:4260 length:111 start_codon:yes stop_codon:yes gene_type:complete